MAVEQAYGHLRSLGHERIGMVLGPEDHIPSRRKLAAMAQVAGWAADEECVERSSFSMEGARVAATKLVERG